MQSSTKDEKLAKLTEKLKALEDGKADDEDVLELGLLASEFQGPYECAFTFEARKGHIHSYNKCKKYSNHDHFIPVNALALRHFPNGYQEQSLLDFIQLQATLTVRLVIHHIGFNRPALHPRTNEKYMFGQFRGLNIISLQWVGTGMTVNVEKQESKEGQRCECISCKHNGMVLKDWYTVTIATARHVVYDENEAKNAVAEFSFLTTDGKERELSVSCSTYEKVNSDACLLKFISHEELFGTHLDNCLRKLQESRVRATQLLYKQPNKPLLPIVSHPHGLNKSVSFGFMIDEMVHTYGTIPGPFSNLQGLSDMLTDSSNFSTNGVKYDTPTCIGSSGAYIFHKDTVFKFLTGSIHEGCFDDGNNQFNFSGDNANLEEYLRDPSLLPSKSVVHGRLKKLLGGAQKNTLQKFKVIPEAENAIRDLRKTAQNLPQEMKVDIDRQLDDTRSFDFRRAAYKIYALCPPGTMTIVADVFKAATAAMKEDANQVLDRFHETFQIRKELGRRFDIFDYQTGGPNRIGRRVMEKYGLPLPPKTLTAEYLVNEARNLQDKMVEWLRILFPPKEQEFEALLKLFKDPSNTQRLYAVLDCNDKQTTRDDINAISNPDVDKCIDDIWNQDPSLMRRLSMLIQIQGSGVNQSNE